MNINKVRTGRQLVPEVGFTNFHNIHVGKKCFICGAGPSIGTLNLKNIHKHVVISVNSSCMLMPWSQEGDINNRFWLSNDTLNLQWTYFWTHVLKTHCNKIVRISWKKYHKKIASIKNLSYFEPRKDQTKLSMHNSRLCYTSSVPSALDFALYMGCKQIYLLGVDHRMLNGNSHYWQFWPQNKWPKRQTKGGIFRPEQKHQLEVFKSNIAVYESLKQYANALGAEIKNCSSISTITVFDKIKFEDAFI